MMAKINGQLPRIDKSQRRGMHVLPSMTRSQIQRPLNGLCPAGGVVVGDCCKTVRPSRNLSCNGHRAQSLSTGTRSQPVHPHLELPLISSKQVESMQCPF